MKKITVINFMLFLFLILFIKVGEAMDSNNQTSKNIHIFFEEIGTSPAFGALSEYVKLPKDDIKIMGFHRFFPLKNINWNENNTFWIELPRGEENYTEKENYFMDKVVEIMKQYPNYNVYFYTGIREYVCFKELRKRLKDNKFKKLYLWEDGFFNIALGRDVYQISNQLAEMNNSCDVETTYFLPKHPLNENNNVYLSLLNMNKCSNVIFKEFDIYNLAITMTDEEKKLFFTIVGFDYHKFEMLREREFFLFSTGHIHSDPKGVLKQTPENMLKILERARTGYYGNIPENAVWVFKLHPSLGILDISPQIKDKYPDMIEIPASVPFETLVLAGMNPSKVIGYGSSFMFWLDREQILRYISHPYYDGLMMKSGKVSDEDIVYPHIPSRDEKDIQFEFIDGGVFPEYIEGRFCKKNDLYNCFLMEKEEKEGCYRLYFDNGKHENYCQ